MKNKNWPLVALAGAIILIVLGFSNFSIPSATLNKEKEVLVTRVIDGDTIEIAAGERVRYLGVDAPETVDLNRPVECFGREASAKNEELVEGQYVRLERDLTERDKYGRLLRYVYVNDKSVNLELVRGGYAVIYAIPPDAKYQKELLLAQREAREAKRGLWGTCMAIQ